MKVKLVRIDWEGRNYEKTDWEMDKARAQKTFGEDKPLYFCLDDTVLLVANDPIDIFDLRRGDSDAVTKHKGWIVADSIDDFERQESQLFESLEA